MIDEVLRSQLQDGYLGMMQTRSRLNGYWDLNEILYLILALVNDYDLNDNRAALAAAARQADYIIEKRQVVDAPMDLIKMNTERAFLALSEATGDAKYRDYAIERVKLREWQEPVIGQHAYSFMNLCLAQWRWIKGRKLQQGRVALMRGPVLFCLNPNQTPNLQPQEITLDVACTPELIYDDHVRPGGLACRVKTSAHDDYQILTEFPDPDGEAVYFLPTAEEVGLEDELYMFPQAAPS